MKHFYYFVSFSYPEQFGMSEIDFPREIKSFDDILEIRDHLSEDNNLNKDDIIVLNYQLLRVES